MSWTGLDVQIMCAGEVSNKEDRVLSQLCSILQFGENREEVIMGRRGRKRKLRPTGGRAISTSLSLGRGLRGSGMALKVTLFFIGDLNWASSALSQPLSSVRVSFEYPFKVNHFYTWREMPSRFLETQSMFAGLKYFLSDFWKQSDFLQSSCLQGGEQNIG